MLRFVSSLCHRLTGHEQGGQQSDDSLALQHIFVLELVPQDFRRELLHRIRTCGSYQNGEWVFCSARALLRLAGAFFAVNPFLIVGSPQDEHFERLARALLIVNDLTLRSAGQAENVNMLHLFEYARRSDWGTTLPRAFDLFGRRLPARIPELDEAFSHEYSVKIDEALTILFGLYSRLMAPVAVNLPPPPMPTKFSFGFLHRVAGKATHPGDRALASVQEHWSQPIGWFSDEFKDSEVNDPSVLPFLRVPLVRVTEDRLWCADPFLLASAASEGIFWRLNEVFKRAGQPKSILTAKLGAVFEDYLADRLRSFGRMDFARAGAKGNERGYPDIWFREDELLVVIEAKAGFVAEDAKYSGAAHATEHLEKLANDSQIARGIEKLHKYEPNFFEGVQQIVPVLVTLDHAWGAATMEANLNSLVRKPRVLPPCDDVYLLPVAELEIAGRWVGERVFARLLRCRRKAAGDGYVTLGDLMTDFREQTAKEMGMMLEPFDAMAQIRSDLHARMNEVFETFKRLGQELTQESPLIPPG
ncbi:MAG: hypothetical protein AB2L07_01840 [Thermoanaerobaculaceae bacterium]